MRRAFLSKYIEVQSTDSLIKLQRNIATITTTSALYFDPGVHPDNRLRDFGWSSQAFELRYNAQYVVSPKISLDATIERETCQENAKPTIENYHNTRAECKTTLHNYSVSSHETDLLHGKLSNLTIQKTNSHVGIFCKSHKTVYINQRNISLFKPSISTVVHESFPTICNRVYKVAQH